MDSNGYISPVIVIGKIKIQDWRKLRIKWDNEIKIDNDIAQTWMRIWIEIN